MRNELNLTHKHILPSSRGEHQFKSGQDSRRYRDEQQKRYG